MLNKKNIIAAIIFILSLIIFLFLISQKPAPIEKNPDQIENQAKTPEEKLEEKENIIIKDNEEWVRDEFGRLVPVKQEKIEINKEELIKNIELQKNAPKAEGEWIIMRKVMQNGKEEITTEKKVFTGGETFEEQLEAMKKILSQENVLSVEPNYLIEIPEKDLEIKKINL